MRRMRRFPEGARSLRTFPAMLAILILAGCGDLAVDVADPGVVDTPVDDVPGDVGDERVGDSGDEGDGDIDGERVGDPGDERDGDTAVADAVADVVVDAVADAVAEAVADAVAEAVDSVEDPSGDPSSDLPRDTWPEGVVSPRVEERQGLKVVWLAGSPYEMGRQQGRLLHDAIASALEYIAADALMASLPVLAADTGVLDLLEATAYPDVVDECRGLVDEAGDVGLDMAECMVLNGGDVMMHFVLHGLPPDWVPPQPGCSGAVVRGPATVDGGLLHARNLDWGGMDIAIVHRNPVLFVRQPDGGIPHVVLGFPLNLSPYTGMNEAGISLGTNQVDPVGPDETSGLGRSNVQMTRRILATSRSLADVEAFLRSEPHMITGTLVVADGTSGTGAFFEKSPQAIAARLPDGNGLVYGTNHFVSSEMAERDDPGKGKGTLRRFNRLQQLLEPGGLESVHGRIDPDVLAGVMQDIRNPDNAHVPSLEELEAQDWDNGEGLGCNGPMHLVIFDPGHRRLWIAAGEPPLHVKPYACFSLDELLGRQGNAVCDPLAIGGHEPPPPTP